MQSLSVKHTTLTDKMTHHIRCSHCLWNTLPLQTKWLTTQDIVAICSQTHKVLLVDVSGESVDGVGTTQVPQLQLAVCWPVQSSMTYIKPLSTCPIQHDIHQTHFVKPFVTTPIWIVEFNINTSTLFATTHYYHTGVSSHSDVGLGSMLLKEWGSIYAN